MSLDPAVGMGEWMRQTSKEAAMQQRRGNPFFRIATLEDADPVGSIKEGRWTTAPAGYLMEDGTAYSRTTYVALYELLNPVVGTPTVTIATPGVFTLVSHGMKDGQKTWLATDGALPTGLLPNTLYYVVSSAADTFRLALTLGGAAINTTGSQSGTHTIHRTYGVGDGTTTFNVPDSRGMVLVAMTTADTDFERLGKQGGAKTVTHSHVLSDLGQAALAWAASAAPAVLRRIATTFTPNVKTNANVAALVAESASQTLGIGLMGTTDSSSPSVVQPYDTINRAIKY